MIPTTGGKAQQLLIWWHGKVSGQLRPYSDSNNGRRQASTSDILARGGEGTTPLK